MDKIKFRKTIKPKLLTDLSACMFICGVIPAIYWFEVFIVLPSLFGWSLYICHAVLGSFILVNIIGNLLALMIVDTSTQGIILPSQVLPGWHVCAECESVAPPRARHCHTCKTCILKKEHHCIFAGYCVGLTNHRYFYIFLLYMWLSTMYCSGLNMFFIWPYVEGLNVWALLRIFFPGVWLIWNPCTSTLYTFLFSINLLGFLFMSVLVYYYTSLLISNVTTTEYNGQKIKKYDYGMTNNIKVSLGNKWYLTWLSPTISSPLPFDGLEWVEAKMTANTHQKMK